MKKKRRAPFTPGAVTSIEEMEKLSAKDAFTQQAHQQKPEIVLNLGNGEDVTFKLVVIEPSEIERKTTVFSGNDRIQDSLNTFTLRDLIPSIRQNGMTFPAIGRELSDGRYETLDGSRRRAACIITAQPYFMYITDSKHINENTARYLSEIGNLYKQLSQYEQGRRYSKLMDQGYTAEDLAKKDGVSRIKIYQARDAFQLPKVFYEAHASSFDLGRPRINSYRKMVNQAKEQGFEQDFLKLVSTITPDTLASRLELDKRVVKKAIGVAQKSNTVLNEADFSNVLECSNISELMGHPEEIELLGLADTIIRIVDKAAAKEISEAFEMLSPAQKKSNDKSKEHSVFKGKTSSVISTTAKDGARLTLHGVPPEQQQDIEQLIADYLREKEKAQAV